MTTSAASPRRARRTAGALIAALALTGAIYGPTVASAAPGPPERLLVKFAPGTKAAAAQNALAGAGATRRGIIPQLGVQVVTVPRGKGAGALKKLRSAKSVRYAERDAKVSVALTPSDPWWPNQGAMVKIGAPTAWDTTTGSPSTVIAVIDTGVDPAQPDLAGGFVAGWDFVGNDADPRDEHGHGTKATGVSAARISNGLGLAGACGDCSIMPLRAMGSDGTGSMSAIANAIVWATDRGAKVINMSLGGPSGSSTLQSAVTYAAQRDVVLVASAGNYGTTSPVYPAAYPEVIAVAGTDGSDALYSWSTRGSWVEMAAPGCNMTTGTFAWYGSFCGTSSAAPVVSGVAGLLRSAAPTATRADIRAALTSTAVPVGPDVAHGRVNAAAAMSAVAGGGRTSPSPPGGVAAPVNSAPPVISGTAEVGRSLTAGTGTWSNEPTSYAYQWQRCDAAGGACADIAGATGSGYAVVSDDLDRTLRVRVTASNGGGSAAAASAATAAVTAAAPVRTTTTFSGSLNAKKPSANFALNVGDGQADATLSFSKTDALGLELRSGGATLLTARGGSPVRATRTLSAGGYVWVVSAPSLSKPTSFTLTVTHTAP